MASIKEAYDSTIGESFTGLKLLLWAIPFGYCRKAMTSGSMDIISTIIVSIFILLLLGFLAESANNACEKKPELVPGIKIFSMILNGIKSLIALSVYFAIALFGTQISCSYINLGEHTVLSMSLKILIGLLFYALPVSGFAVYIRKLDIFEAYNLKKVFYILGEAFMMFSYLIIKLGLLTAIVIGFISYLFWLFVGLDNYLINYIWSIAIMYNLVIGTNYIAQFSEEWMTLYEKKNQVVEDGVKLY